MASIDQTERTTNEGDPEMERILAEMLEADETITARAVARKHPAIKHASSVTRSQARSDLLARYVVSLNETSNGWRTRCFDSS